MKAFFVCLFTHFLTSWPLQYITTWSVGYLFKVICHHGPVLAGRVHSLWAPWRSHRIAGMQCCHWGEKYLDNSSKNVMFWLLKIALFHLFARNLEVKVKKSFVSKINSSKFLSCLTLRWQNSLQQELVLTGIFWYFFY